MRIDAHKHCNKFYTIKVLLEMKTRGIKGLALGLMMLSGIGATQADNKDKTEKEYNELINALNEVSENAFIEAHGLSRERKVFVFDMDGGLLLEANESTLYADQYKIIFQSDLVMESAGNQIYIINRQLPKSTIAKK